MSKLQGNKKNASTDKQVVAYISSLENRSNINIKAESMSVIRTWMTQVKKPDGWDWQLWESSAAVYERRRKVVLKVDSAGRVFIDKKSPNGNIRSIKLEFETTAEACAYIQDYINRNYLH